MERISEDEVEMTPFEGILHREFQFSEHDLLHEYVDREFWCWLSDADRVFTALDYGEDRTRATAWFWQVDDVWVAVVGEAEVENWWDGGKPPEALGVVEWQRPIYLWPESGWLRWRDQNGDVRKESAV